MKLSLIPILLFSAILLIPISAFAYTTDSPLYACEPVSGSLASASSRISLINVTDGTVISSVNMHSNWFAWCSELSVDPTTSIWYTIPQSGHKLHTVDPTTGDVVNLNGTIGGTWDDGSFSNTSSMAFDGNGDLFITQNGYPNPTTSLFSIYKLDKSTGNEISFCTPSNPYTMELAFNYDNDKMYSITNSNSLQVVDPNTCAVSETVSITGLVGSPTSLSYNTQDGLFYVMVKDGGGTHPNETGTLDYYTLQTDGTANLITDDVTNAHVGIQTVYTGLDFSIFPDPPDNVAPVISGTEAEPITLFENEIFLPFDKVQCIDDVDGEIVPNGNFWYVGGITIDISNRGTQYQDYDCTDAGDNTGYATIEYIIKKISTGGSSPSTVGGTFQQNDIPRLEDIPVLSFSDSPSQVTPTEGQSISDLFANLFDNRITEGITTPAPSVSSGSPAPTQTNNPVVDFFSNLFANWFS